VQRETGPIITLMAGVFFDGAAWVMMLSHFVGILATMPSGLILRRLKLFKSSDSPFVMELPPYCVPSFYLCPPSSPVEQVLENSASRCQRHPRPSVIVWALSNFDYDSSPVAPESSMLFAIEWLKLRPYLTLLGFVGIGEHPSPY